ncbi:MAG: RNA polymerase sigma factor [Anaerolineales bacterium]|nr:RNA polymerase sigma factor [Anaerolineales bacterium]
MRLATGNSVYPIDDDLTELIARCLQGDQTALAALYHAYANDVYRLVYGLLGDREDAEEVVQDTFVYAMRQLNRYDPVKAGFRTWLFIIATSRARNKRRRKWLPTVSLRFFLESEIGPDAGLQPRPAEARVETGAREDRVRSALGELSTKLREAAVLRYFEGLTYREIGQILGIPKKTAESRVRLAHKALRDLMADENYE